MGDALVEKILKFSVVEVVILKRPVDHLVLVLGGQFGIVVYDRLEGHLLNFGNELASEPPCPKLAGLGHEFQNGSSVGSSYPNLSVSSLL